jgi:type 1 glutamine amidotransferase
MNIYIKIKSLLFLGIFLSLLGCQQEVDKKIVILAGTKSHPATMHEYIKNARLIKVMLDEAPELPALTTEIHYNGWPEDETTLLNADLIITISDGRDGPNGLGVPFMTDKKMTVLGQAVENGAGFMTFHYSTFSPDQYGDEMLAWSGGYFDWQNDQGEREWYSDIKFLDEEVSLVNKEHPVLRGVNPFQIYEEYYYDLRFSEDRSGLVPLIEVPGLNSDRESGNVVAWALNRKDGGRGFGTTMGHLYANWKNENYRKFLLNAIAWTAGCEIPPEGLTSAYYSDPEVTKKMFKKDYKGLILTGENHPAHLWEKTTPVLKTALELNGKVHVDVSVDINDLFQYDLRDYDFLAFNYANWENPDALWEGSKKALIDYVNSGGSLMFIHFSNGAFHYSLPGAEASDWPEYRKFCRRVWDHTAESSHDKYGKFEVKVVDHNHELTRGIQNFEVTDELYYKQAGEETIQVLLSAISTDTDNEEPQAWIYELTGTDGKNSRVFQTVLGHDSTIFMVPEFQEILSRSAIWLSRGTERWNDL